MSSRDMNDIPHFIRMPAILLNYILTVKDSYSLVLTSTNNTSVELVDTERSDGAVVVDDFDAWNAFLVLWRSVRHGIN
jgi:hypothetical protein